jgi:hypothetical protein
VLVFNQGETMKKLFLATTLLTALALLSTAAESRYQRGYVKKNGTYVQGHQKTNPDAHRYNNRGSQTNGGRQRDEYSSNPAYNKRRNR